MLENDCLTRNLPQSLELNTKELVECGFEGMKTIP